MIRLALATLAGWGAGFVAGAWFATSSLRRPPWERAWVCLRCRERVAFGDVHGCRERLSVEQLDDLRVMQRDGRPARHCRDDDAGWVGL
jgi:hypothetical protein